MEAVREDDVLGATCLAHVDRAQLDLDLVGPVIRRLLRNCAPGSVEFRQNDFDQAIEDLHEYHRRPTIPLSLGCGLTNLDMYEEVELADDLRLLLPFDDERIELQMRLTSGLVGAGAPTHWAGPLWRGGVLELRIDWDKRGLPPRNLDSGLIHGLHALRLTREGTALPSMIWPEPTTRFADFAPNPDTISGE